MVGCKECGKLMKMRVCEINHKVFGEAAVQMTIKAGFECPYCKTSESRTKEKVVVFRW